MSCSLIALNSCRSFANLSELMRGLLSARCRYRFHYRNLVFVITNVNCCLNYLVDTHSHLLNLHRYLYLFVDMKSSWWDKSSSEDTSKFSKYSRASWTFINFLAAVLYSYMTQTKELANDAKVKKQTVNSW